MVWNPESTIVWNPKSIMVWILESRKLEGRDPESRTFMDSLTWGDKNNWY